MDAQRLAAHAAGDDYLDARASMLDIDGSRAAARQDEHWQGLGEALGLDLAGEGWREG